MFDPVVVICILGMLIALWGFWPDIKQLRIVSEGEQGEGHYIPVKCPWRPNDHTNFRGIGGPRSGGLP
jgi:hypothetical protein